MQPRPQRAQPGEDRGEPCLGCGRAGGRRKPWWASNTGAEGCELGSLERQSSAIPPAVVTSALQTSAVCSVAQSCLFSTPCTVAH